MQKTLSQPLNQQSSNANHQRGRQQSPQYVLTQPTQQTVANSPIRNQCPPNLFQSLQSLQKIFQKDQSEFQSIKQQIQTKRVNSHSPSINKIYNPQGLSIYDQNQLSNHYQQSLRQQKNRYSQIPQNIQNQIQLQASKSPKIAPQKLGDSITIIQQYMSSDVKQGSNCDSYQTSNTKQQTNSDSQLMPNFNRYSSFNSQQALTDKENNSQSTRGNDSSEVWKQRYSALEKNLSQKVFLLEGELKESQTQIALYKQNQQGDLRNAVQSASETQILLDESANLQRQRALLVQQMSEKDMKLESYNELIKKMSGQLDSYEKALNLLQNSKINNGEEELRLQNQKQAQYIKKLQFQIKSIPNTTKDLENLVQARNQIDQFVLMMQNQKVNGASSQANIGGTKDSMNLSVSWVHSNIKKQIPAENSVEMSCNENVPVKNMKRFQGMGVSGNEFSDQKPSKIELNESIVNLSQVIKNSLMKRNKRRQ